MKYPYSVKANGKWYRPNEEVPETSDNQIADIGKKVEPETVSETETVENSVETVESAAETEQKAPKKAKKDSGKE